MLGPLFSAAQSCGVPFHEDKRAQLVNPSSAALSINARYRYPDIKAGTVKAMTTVTLAEAGANLPQYVNRVRTQHDRVVLTQHDQPAAVLISTDELEELEETLDLLNDPQARVGIPEGEADITAGRVVTADELRTKYLT
jgi:prevent-host-death family protein